MMKRRFAVLGAVAALTIAGLSGSALAGTPTPSAAEKVVCKTADGKVIELAAPLRRAAAGEGRPAGKSGEIEWRKARPMDASGTAPAEVTRPAQASGTHTVVETRPAEPSAAGEETEPKVVKPDTGDGRRLPEEFSAARVSADPDVTAETLQITCEVLDR